MNSLQLEHLVSLNRPQNIFLETQFTKIPHNDLQNLEYTVAASYFYHPNQNYARRPIVEEFRQNRHQIADQNIKRLQSDVTINKNDIGKANNNITQLKNRLDAIEKYFGS
jgi:hypothetical protein